MNQSDQPPETDEIELPPWDAIAITRQRADQRRTVRDAAIEDLRRSMPVEEILAVFGIDLAQIEG